MEKPTTHRFETKEESTNKWWKEIIFIGNFNYRSNFRRSYYGPQASFPVTCNAHVSITEFLYNPVSIQLNVTLSLFNPVCHHKPVSIQFNPVIMYRTTSSTTEFTTNGKIPLLYYCHLLLFILCILCVCLCSIITKLPLHKFSSFFLSLYEINFTNIWLQGPCIHSHSRQSTEKSGFFLLPTSFIHSSF